MSYYLRAEMHCPECEKDIQAEGEVSLDMFYWTCPDCKQDFKSNWEGMK